MVVDKLDRRRRRASFLLGIGALVVVIMVAVLVASFTASQRSNDRTIGAIETARANGRIAFAVIDGIARVEMGHRGYASGDSVQGDRETYERGVAETERALLALAAAARATPEIADAAANLRGAAEARLAFCARVVALVDRGRRGEASALLLSREGAVTASGIRTEAFDFVEANEGHVSVLTHNDVAQREASSWLAVAVGLLAAFACFLTTWAVLQERRSWREAHALMQEANAALEQAHAEARASDAAKTRFLAVASHDLRQPLHALSLYLSALKRRTEGPETQKIIANMERATQGMINMFGSLLDLARIQSGVATTQLENIPLAEFFERIAAEFGTGKVRVAATTAIVRTDQRALEGILRNLLSNALKHGGGEASLEARPRADCVLVCVVDSGPGIPEDQHDEIFKEFTRLPNTKVEGLGLGLTIVKRTADRVGLPVIVESKPGQGALFGVVVPAAEQAPAPRTVPALGATPLAGVDIIVVDDDALALGAAAQLLADAGAKIRTASDLAAFDALLDAGPRPDVIIMDLRIGGKLCGVDALNKARARYEEKPAALIITGDTAPETLAALQVSGYSWHNKPLKPQEFTGSVMIANTMARRGHLIDARPFDNVQP